MQRDLKRLPVLAAEVQTPPKPSLAAEVGTGEKPSKKWKKGLLGVAQDRTEKEEKEEKPAEAEEEPMPLESLADDVNDEGKPLESLADETLATIPDSLPLIALLDIPGQPTSSSSSFEPPEGSPAPQQQQLRLWPGQKVDAAGYIVWDDDSDDNN